MKKTYLFTAFIAFGAAVIALLDMVIAIPDNTAGYALFIFALAILAHTYFLLKASKTGHNRNNNWTIDPNWLTDAMFVSDLNGKIHGANDACIELAGGSRLANNVRDLFEAIHARLEDRSQADDVVTAVLSSPDIQFTDTLKMKSGQAIERSTKPIDGADLRLWTLSDVTHDLEVSGDHDMHQTMLEADAARTAEMAEQLYHAKAELEEKQAELTRLANTDSLTGLYNRRRFSALAQEALSKAKEDTMVWVIMMDIDHFKRVNDTYGHSAGDIAIRDFAHIVTETVGTKGFVGRMGGEEFAVLMPNCSINDAFKVAETIRKNTANHQTISDAEKFRFTASLGIACWLPGEISIEATLDRADQALYSAKSYGRNRVVGYE